MDKYEIMAYQIKTGEYVVCCGGEQFESAVGMCEMFNRNVKGFYYVPVRVVEVGLNKKE